jgi:predicted ferric reductase
VLVGTGTGITPYRAMLPLLAERLAPAAGRTSCSGSGGARSCCSARTSWRPRGPTRTSSSPAVTAAIFPSIPSPGNTRATCSRLFSHLGLDPAQDVVYLCGNPGMIDESFEILKAMGFGVKQLRREKYLSARPAR